jgi:hypothetical protein
MMIINFFIKKSYYAPWPYSKWPDCKQTFLFRDTKITRWCSLPQTTKKWQCGAWKKIL